MEVRTRSNSPAEIGIVSMQPTLVMSGVVYVIARRKEKLKRRASKRLIRMNDNAWALGASNGSRTHAQPPPSGKLLSRMISGQKATAFASPIVPQSALANAGL